MKNYLLILLFLVVVISSCNKNDDTPVIEEEKVEEEEVIEEVDITVQNFMWQTLNAYYFWQESVSDLADNRFSTESEYVTFLTSNPDPENFITNKLEDIQSVFVISMNCFYCHSTWW